MFTTEQWDSTIFPLRVADSNENMNKVRNAAPARPHPQLLAELSLSPARATSPGHAIKCIRWKG